MLDHAHEMPEPGHRHSPDPGLGRDPNAVLQPFATVLVETAPDAIILADNHGTIILWNRAAQNLFGYCEEEMLGQPLTCLMPARYREMHQKGLERVRAAGHSTLAGKAVELFGLRKDGTEFPLELSLGTWQCDGRLYFSGIIRDITGRKRSEEVLRESQERYRQLVEQARDIIYRTDAQGRFTFVNPTTSRIMGYSEQELLGRRFVELIRPDMREAAERFYGRQFVRRAPSTYYEFPAISKDGREFWFGQNVQVLLDNDQVVGFHAVTRDITERKRSEEALHESQERFRQLAENIREVFWMSDPEKNRVIYISPGYEAIWGRTCESLYAAPRSWLESIHPDDRNRVIEAALTRQVSGGYNEEYRIVRPDGSTRWIWDRAFPIRDASGHVYRIAGIAEDLTDRKQTELALQQAYDATEMILDSVPGAILVADPDLRVVYANALACRYFGEAQADMIGALLNDVLPADVAQRSWVFTRRTPQAAENGYWQQDRQFERRGKVYQYRFFPLAIRGSERPQTGIVIWDITENKRLADQIMQAEKLASLGTLVAGMAHEVNNPAQSIMGLAQLLEDETDLRVVREYAGDIVRYTKHIATVVRDFLTYARQSDRDDATDLDVGERMAEAVKLLRRSPQFGHIEIVTDFQAVPLLNARRTEIDQVFVNLISNAVQAMDGRGCLTLTTSLRGGALTATVRDTAGGIPQDRLTKIFDPFYTTKEPGKGTGLGLYIVYKIVTKYGGQIHVDSKVGHGTTFTVAFPLGHVSPQGGQS